jgi:divalent metal cation (Fe/Co/Zn/Cd) transporter
MTDGHEVALRRAARLAAATALWNLSVGGASVATAVATGSLSLIGFGINAVVDSAASSLLVWRFRAAAAGHAERAARVEHLALRVAGAAFTVVAIYLSAQAVRSLATGAHASTRHSGSSRRLRRSRYCPTSRWPSTGPRVSCTAARSARIAS